MRFRSIEVEGEETAAVVLSQGAVALRAINRATGADWPNRVEELVQRELVSEFRAWVAEELDRLGDVPSMDPRESRDLPILRRPPKILGVGLNYEDHAGDLGERRPSEPATFMKPWTTIVGPGATVPIPIQSERTTGEAELGLVVGRRCKDVSEAEAPEVIAGVTTLIDMTAEDILRRNPRFLTRAKSFDGFLVVGSELVTVDELGDIGALEVATVHNGRAHRTNVVANMMFSPWYLVSFFSQIMPLEPGDVISTGTPGAAVLRDGDEIGCRIPGVGEIVNPVADLKVREIA